MTRIEFKLTVIVDTDDENVDTDKIEEQILYDLPRYIPYNEDDVYSIEGYELDKFCPLPDVKEKKCEHLVINHDHCADCGEDFANISR